MFDVFGFSSERKMEQQLLVEYEQTLADVLEGINEHNYQTAIEIASLPEKIRGFGHVKEHNRKMSKERGAVDGCIQRFSCNDSCNSD